MKPSIQQHNRTIDVIKGICISLMVIAHSGCYSWMGNVIYLFHMPCFFWVSGYLFKDKYLDYPMHFIYRKIKGLWWKFIVWSVIFLIFHHIFFKFHIYHQDYDFKDYKRMLFHILTLTRTEQLLGGYWFLKDLLYGSIIGFYCLKIEYCIQNRYSNCRKEILSLLILVVILLITCSNIYFPFHIPTISTHVFLACTFYLTGVFVQRYGIMNKLLNFKHALSSSIILLVISFFYKSSMSATGINAVLYYIVALFGIIPIYYLSTRITSCKNVICKIADRTLNYIGTKTFHILTFHFLGFKLVTVAIILLSSKYRIEDLASFPVLSAGSLRIWIIYTVVSISFSLLVSHLMDVLKLHIGKKSNTL